jgi:hypothetical protein
MPAQQSPIVAALTGLRGTAGIGAKPSLGRPRQMVGSSPSRLFAEAVVKGSYGSNRVGSRSNSAPRTDNAANLRKTAHF